MGIVVLPAYEAGLTSGDPDIALPGTGEALPGGVETILEYNGAYLNIRDWIDTYLVTQIDGLGDADLRDSREVNPGSHGETYFQSYYGGRTIVLSGRIRAHTLGKLRDMQMGLKQMFWDTSVERALIFRTGNINRDAMIFCKKSQPIVMSEIQQDFRFYRDFQITLRASNPRFYSVLEVVNSTKYGYTETFSVSPFSNGVYTLVTGAAPTVSGGVMQGQAAANIHWTYTGPANANIRRTIKYKTGTVVNGSQQIGLYPKFISTATKLSAYVTVNGASSALRITRTTGGTTVTLATSANFTLAASTTYWLRAYISGNNVTVEQWTTDPVLGGAPAVSTTATLAGADATSLGSGVSAVSGGWINGDLSTGYELDDDTYEPMATGVSFVADNKGSIATQPTFRLFGPLNAPTSGGLAARIRRSDQLAQPIMINAKTGTTTAIAANRYLEIDTDKRTMKEYDATNDSYIGNAYGQLDVGSLWFEYDSGKNSVEFDTFSYGTTRIDSRHRHAYA